MAAKRPAKRARKRTKTLTRDAARTLYERLSARDPHPTTELEHRDPYTLLVAVTLSAQATDVGVNRATGPLFKTADTPEKMVALGVDRLGEYIKTIGLWRNKAKNVIALSQILIDEHGGAVPREREALERLPGVGRKTANVVCNVAFGQPTIAVDTHIFRVSNRTGLAPGATPNDVEAGLEKITPPEFLQHAHHWLILHGRYVCKARTPDCQACVLPEICLYKDKTPAPDAASKPAKKAAGKTVKTTAKKKRAAASRPKSVKAKKKAAGG